MVLGRAVLVQVAGFRLLLQSLCLCSARGESSARLAVVTGVRHRVAASVRLRSALAAFAGNPLWRQLSVSSTADYSTADLS